MILNTGQLVTEQFNEQSTFGIVGPIPNDINIIEGFTFAEVNNTTPGTFDIDLSQVTMVLICCRWSKLRSVCYIQTICY